MSLTLARVVALEHAARSLLILTIEIRKEIEQSRPVEDEPVEDASASDGEDPCPGRCTAQYRMATPVMGHPSRTKCRMCGRTYD